MLTVVADGCPDDGCGEAGSSSLVDEIVRAGARRMLAEALAAEVDACVAAFTRRAGR
jgi:putative transposase